MAVSTGFVTVTASDGGHVVALTTDSTGFALASAFSGVTAAFASAAGSFSGTGFFAAGNNIGSVSPSGFSNILVGDGTTLSYADTVSGAVITSGNGNDTIVAGGNDTIDAGAGSNVILLAASSAADTVTTAGNDTISAFSNALNFTNDGASAVINLYGGTLTVSGSGTADVYAGSSATITVTDSGNDTFVFNQPLTSGADGSSVMVNASAATGNQSFWAGSGNVTLVGGSGNDTFAGGQGAATITAGSGTNLFGLYAQNTTASTALTVNGFTSKDGIGLADFSTALTFSIATEGTSTVFSLSNGASITLVDYAGPVKLGIIGVSPTSSAGGAS